VKDHHCEKLQDFAVPKIFPRQSVRCEMLFTSLKFLRDGCFLDDMRLEETHKTHAYRIRDGVVTPSYARDLLQHDTLRLNRCVALQRLHVVARTAAAADHHVTSDRTFQKDGSRQDTPPAPRIHRSNVLIARVLRTTVAKRQKTTTKTLMYRHNAGDRRRDDAHRRLENLFTMGSRTSSAGSPVISAAASSVFLLVVEEVLRALGQLPALLLLQLHRRLHLAALVDLHRGEAQAQHQRLEGQDVEEQRHVVQRLGVREGSQVRGSGRGHRSQVRLGRTLSSA